LLENTRFLPFLPTSVLFEAHARVFLWELGYESWSKKLEYLGYWSVKTSWYYRYWFSLNTSV